MRKPDTIVDEIHEIRRKIEERTKDMTPAEHAAYFNESGRQLAEQYGFKIYKNVEEAERDRALGRRVNEAYTAPIKGSKANSNGSD